MTAIRIETKFSRELLKQQRIKGISRRKLGRESGVSYAYMINIALRGVIPSPTIINKLVKVLGEESKLPLYLATGLLCPELSKLLENTKMIKIIRRLLKLNEDEYNNFLVKMEANLW